MTNERDPRDYERLCAYVLGEARDDERRAMEARLAADAGLRREKARIEATIGLVRDTLGDDLALSPSAERALIASVATEGRSRARGRGKGSAAPGPSATGVTGASRVGLLRVAASIALIGAGAWGFVRLQGEPEEVRHRSTEAARAERSLRPEALRTSDPAPARTGGGAVADETVEDGAASSQAEAARPIAIADFAGELPAVRSEALDPATSAQLLDFLREEAARMPSRSQTAVAGESAEPSGGAEAALLALSELAFEASSFDDVLGVPVQATQVRDGEVSTQRDGPSTAGGSEAYALAVQVTGKAYEGGSAGGGRGGAYRGPGDVAPPPPPEAAAGSGGDAFFLGQGERRRSSGAASSGGSTAPDVVVGTGGGSGGSYGGVSLGGPVAMAGPAAPSPGGGAAPAAPPAEIAERRAAGELHLGRRVVGGAPPGGSGLDSPDAILELCRRRPSESPSAMFFRLWGDNPFERALRDPLSTFAVDVDTASYALARRYLRAGHVPAKAQVRTEEFVNYFAPDLPAPFEETFAIELELAPSRYGSADRERWLLRVGLRGTEVERDARDPLALTFVVDVSGSMREENRLELVKHALRLLVGELDANDSVAIVAFSNEARLVLPTTSAANRGLIESAVHGLHAGGGTHAEAGLRMGYELAAQDFADHAQNRVVLLSDGVANVGETDRERITASVREHRERGIFLNTVGVGLGNHDDALLEQLADRGDGLCNYVDDAAEARRALVENFTGAFQAIARDVKVQVEFDPAQVERYRLLGYENRAIADADFRNDAVDAGEVGAGHQVVALYELERTGVASDASLATVRVRYEPLRGVPSDGADPVRELERSLTGFEARSSFEAASAGYRRSAIAAQFAELLRRSVHARGDSLDLLIADARALAAELRAGGGDERSTRELEELVELLTTSRELILAGLPGHDELALAVDALRRNHVLRAELEDLLAEDATQEREADAARLDELERLNEELELRIRELLEKRGRR